MLCSIRPTRGVRLLYFVGGFLGAQSIIEVDDPPHEEVDHCNRTRADSKGQTADSKKENNKNNPEEAGVNSGSIGNASNNPA